MGTRQTSIDCYNKIQAQGLLSKRRLEVLNTILQSAPCTSSEAITNAKVKFGVFGVSSRFTELRDLGVIYEKGIKKCTVTGRNVIEWDLTDRLPIDKKVTSITKKQKISDALYVLNQLRENRIEPTSAEWKKLELYIKII
jgi:hypothetical protein